MLIGLAAFACLDLQVQVLALLVLFALQTLQLLQSLRRERAPARFLQVLGIVADFVEVADEFFLQISEVRYLNRMPVLPKESNDGLIAKDVDVGAERVHVLREQFLPLLDDLLGLPHESLRRERGHLVLVEVVFDKL